MSRVGRDLALDVPILPTCSQILSWKAYALGVPSMV